MAEKAYYLILPLLLYGLAVADLISSWRSLLRVTYKYPIMTFPTKHLC